MYYGNNRRNNQKDKKRLKSFWTNVTKRFKNASK